MDPAVPPMRAVPPGVVRWLAMAACLAVSIPGMIVSSVRDNPGAAINFGLVGAAATLCLIAVTAVVVDPSPLRVTVPLAGPAGVAAHEEAEALGAALERQIGALVEAGADEKQLRDTVRLALRLASARRVVS